MRRYFPDISRGILQHAGAVSPRLIGRRADARGSSTDRARVNGVGIVHVKNIPDGAWREFRAAIAQFEYRVAHAQFGVHYGIVRRAIHAENFLGAEAGFEEVD